MGFVVVCFFYFLLFGMQYLFLFLKTIFFASLKVLRQSLCLHFLVFKMLSFDMEVMDFEESIDFFLW
jgi:hypothetical protein